MIKLKELYNNKKDIISSLFIVIFILLTIFLTTNLWYTNLANGGSFFNRTKSTITNNVEKADFIKPFRVLTTNNGEYFSGVYSNELTENFVTMGEDIIIKALSEGEFIGNGDINDDIFKKENAVIYDYRYFLEGSHLAECLNLKNSSWNRINLFDMIIFSVGENELIELDFVNREDNTYTRFILDNKSEVVSLKNRNTSVNTEIRYVINFNENTPIKKYTIIPTWRNSEYVYNEISSVNSYTNDFGEVTIKNIEENINLFFENPLNKMFSRKDNQLIFSDANTNVKYYDVSKYNIGLIEYAYYNYGSKNLSNTVVNDFIVAKSIIEKDEIQTNEYYMTGYTVDEMESVFKFDYIINNLPIYFSPDYEELLGVTSAIEVTVRNGVVIKYKKIANNYVISDTKNTATTGIDTIIGTIFSDEDIEEIKNITLAYKLDFDKNLGLHWFGEAYNSVFSQTTEGE